jgi:Domain of unknown function (DUF4431)
MKFALSLVMLAALPLTATAASSACMTFDQAGQIAEGRLSVGRFKDAADRPESAFILRLPVATCLDASDPEFRVKSTRTIHVYSTDERTSAQINRFVGKTVLVRGRPFGAHTAHHHAPIVMDITEIDNH